MTKAYEQRLVQLARGLKDELPITISSIDTVNGQVLHLIGYIEALAEDE
jgi:hypothetical protein